LLAGGKAAPLVLGIDYNAAGATGKFSILRA
jgi:hypothetical protein